MISRIKPEGSLIQPIYYNILARERERERERDDLFLISVSLLLNKFKIDQESSIFYPGQICSFCSIELKKLKLHGIWSFNPLYNLS